MYPLYNGFYDSDYFEKKKVKDMYTYASENNIKLLSDFNATFWNEYKTNYARYDKLFRRYYKDFYYFLQEKDDTIATITTNFADDVYNHLMINSRKYEELYRTHVITDEDYSIIDNYRISEVMDRETTSDNTNTYGTQSNTSENEVAPYDTETYYNQNKISDTIGTREDTLNNDSTEDYTLTRRGNIGVATGTDMLVKHNNFWDKYKFYEYIFANISADLLSI